MSQSWNTTPTSCVLLPSVPLLELTDTKLTHLQPVLDIQARHGILIEAYGPLSPLLRHPTGGPIKPILTRIAQRLSAEMSEEIDAAMVLLLWTRAKGVVAVTASGNEGRIRKMKRTMELPDLREEEVREIEEAGKRVHFRAYVGSLRFVVALRADGVGWEG